VAPEIQLHAIHSFTCPNPTQNRQQQVEQRLDSIPRLLNEHGDCMVLNSGACGTGRKLEEEPLSKGGPDTLTTQIEYKCVKYPSLQQVRTLDTR